jgi:hypothetical protein
MLPLEIVRCILSYVSIDLIKRSNHYVLRLAESHPICTSLTHMINTKWIFQSDYLSTYEDWDEYEVLQSYRSRDDFVYQDCVTMFRNTYIYTLCVKNRQIVHLSTQKYENNYGMKFMCERINLLKKEEQSSSLYYSVHNEVSAFMKYI